MSIFNFFNKKTKPDCFFKFKKNNEGVEKVVQWMKDEHDLIIDISSDDKLKIYIDKNGSHFINIYTDVTQRVPAYKKKERFIIVTYNDVVNIFNENYDLEYIWLNPYSDSVQIKRKVFSPTYTIKKDTSVLIGSPANPPKEIINFLVNFGKKDTQIENIYLALMSNGREFSFVVNIDAPQSKSIVQSIGSDISKICKEHQIPYPVDFVYDDFIVDEQYLIYTKRN